MKKLQKTFIIYILIITSALALPAPDWAETGTHKKYPQSNYILGVGISEDKTTATELARADVAKQIRVNIESELETIEQEFSENNRRSLISEVSSRTKSVVSETIAGIEIKETRKSRGNYYVLAVLNKNNYIAGLEQDLNDISADISRHLNSARELTEKGSLFAALDSYTSAQNKMPDYYVKRSLYTALTGKGVAQNVPTPARIQSEILALFSSFHIDITSGNNQSGMIGTTLSNPIIAFIYVTGEGGEEFGLRQFPVNVKYTNGETLGLYKTNDSGELSISPVVAPGGRITLTPDFHNVPGQYRSYLPKVQARASYSVETSDLSFAIRIRDISGQESKRLNQTVATLINQNGYQIDSSAPLKIQGGLLVSRERTVNSPAGKQFLVDVELTLSLTDANNNVQLATVTGRGRGMAVGSREQAIAEAADNIDFSTSEFAAFLQAANQ